MPQPNDLSRSLAALDENSTLIAVIEMSQTSWLVAGIVPRVERHPLKKLAPDVEALRGRLRSRPRRLLAGSLAVGARHRSLCDPSEQHCRFA